MFARNLYAAAILLCTALTAPLPGLHAAGAGTALDSYLSAHRAAGDRPNRLIHSSSPYLLQHAYNPVDWHTWGDAAFDKARRENKPVFLSIGYSTCHWCHVMAKESFENPQLAAFLNEHFISIKVDREQRPDVDEIYMSAAYVLNGHGGWPLTAFLDHDRRPFHVGIYYPPTQRDGHIGMDQLLEKVHALWTQQPERVEEAAAALAKAVSSNFNDTGEPVEITPTIFGRALTALAEEFDAEHGGFGSAPKFPPHGKLSLLQAMAASAQPYSRSALEMLTTTLDAMARGGIQDQLGGGFHRYAVDASWMQPHFEKMLYTQALMALAYTQLYELEADPLYRETALRTLDFALGSMRSPDGAFYSAFDADSLDPRTGEKSEGAYYLWRQQEIEENLSQACSRHVREKYAIEPFGNLLSADEEMIGYNVLHVREAWREQKSTDAQLARSEQCRRELLALRERRAPPSLDDKVITAWNAMMVTALTEAARVFDRPDYRTAAQRTMKFLLQRLRSHDGGKLLRSYRDGSARLAAVLNDYVWMVHALLTLHRDAAGDRWLKHALEQQQLQQRLFYDSDGGGYYNAAAAEGLIARTKTADDDTLPSANAMAIVNLGMLARYSGDARWKRLQSAVIDAFSAALQADPATRAAMTAALVPVLAGSRSDTEGSSAVDAAGD